jgi:hypothetical protein
MIFRKLSKPDICSLLLTVLFFKAALIAAEETNPNQKLFTSAAFDQDGKLWRVVPDQRYVSVDYSTDYGKTFRKAVRVNTKPQPINSWDENPPTIVIDPQGWVNVLYFADSKQPYTSYFSQSKDGVHFSKPISVSSKAAKYIHYQAEMLTGSDKKIHFLWHDARDEAEYSKHGGGDLSLYYSAIDIAKTDVSKIRQFPQDRRIAKNICSCCRTAAALDKDGLPVVLARFVYPGNIRDFGMLKLTADGKASEPWRVTHDDWKIEGCPTHGPALSIGQDGRYLMAWFTQGKQGAGLFYAESNNAGQSFSKPLSFGNTNNLAGHADVLALRDKVFLVWREFAGGNTQILTMRSENEGRTWTAPKRVAETSSQAAHPSLISNGKRVFIAWNSLETGFRLIAADE